MTESSLADLDLLLEQLRFRGIAVGATELQRLQAVFTHSPDLSHDGLRDLLCHLLAKDTHQRHIVRSSFDRLVPRDFNPSATPALTPQNLQLPKPLQTQVDVDEEVAPPPPPPPKNLARISLVALVASLLLVISLFIADNSHQDDDKAKEKANKTTITKPIVVNSEVSNKPIQSALELVPTIELWTPQVEAPRKRKIGKMLLPALLLLLGAGSGFVWLLYKTQRITRQRMPQRPETPKGTGRSWLPGMKDQSFKLLSGRERREIAWGIGQRFNELPRRQLDIQRTVKQSAKEAMPQIVLQHARSTREIWLWQERFSDNPDLIQLADEIMLTLSAANIVVQNAYFRGLPKHLTNEQGKVLRDVEPLRQQLNPILLLFLDVEQLAQYRQNQPDSADKLLHQLGRWPNTIAVDAGNKPGQLAAYLKSYGLSCLLPEAVPQWLISQSEHYQDNPQQQIQLMQWAIACALPNRLILEDEARALHDELGLAINWHYSALQRYNIRPQQDLEFAHNRIPLLNQFARHRVDNEAWTQAALQFWAKRYAAIDQQLADKETSRRRWQATHEQQRHIRLNQALLQLWQTPGGTTTACEQAATKLNTAVATLHDIHSHDKLRDDVEQALKRYRFEGQPDTTADDENVITLPFAWDVLGIETQRQLLECGLGQPAKTLKTHADGFTRNLLGVLCGLAIAGLVASLFAVIPSVADFRLQANSAVPPDAAMTMQWTETEDDRSFVVGSVKSLLVSGQKIESDHYVPLAWKRDVVLAQQPLTEDGYTQLWRLGTKKKPVRPNRTAEVVDGQKQDWPQWSVAVIWGNSSRENLQRLAAKLLDTGTADQVLLGYGDVWWGKHKELAESAKDLKAQWLYVNFNNLPHQASIHGSEHVALFTDADELLTELNATDRFIKVEDAEKPVWLKGIKQTIPTALPDKPEILLPHDMKLVRIPAGSFRMGCDLKRDNVEGGCQDDEKPVHEVKIPNDFFMSQNEVTFAQYDAYVASLEKLAASPVQKKIDVPPSPEDEGWGRDKRPVINVSWQDAQGYMNWLTDNHQRELEGMACRLPSEAEWEYAVRAGTETAYSWGSSIDKNNANCDGCGSQWDNKQTAPVGSFPPNPFGLYDMHGNVWEWVQDRWHENYQGAPVDGTAWESGESSNRVLRGGSWVGSPLNLRSANRLNNYPGVRSSDIGFRIVCSPPLDR